MKRVLLLNPPGKDLVLRDNYCSFTSKAGYYWPPIDLLALSGLLNSDVQLFVKDAMVERVPWDSCLFFIGKVRPDAVVFLTGQASWTKDLKFMARVKEKFSPLIFASGGTLLVEGRSVMEKHDFIDGVVLNFVENGLCGHIREGKGGINLLWRDGAEIMGREQIFCSDDFSFPVPRHELFPLPRYKIPTARRRPFTCVMTSLGCSFQCGFCVCCLLQRKTRSLDNLFEELKYIKQLGIQEIMFTDPTFTVDRNRVLSICEKMRRCSLDFSWMCNAHASTLDRELLKAMRDAGCHFIEIGIESGSDAVLLKYSKGANTDTLREAVSLCKSQGIEVLGCFILGLAGENKETILSTINFALELDPALGSFSIATPDKGTKLWENSIKEKWVNPEIEDYDSSRSAVIDTGQVSPEEIIRLKKYAYRKFYLRPKKIMYLLRLALKNKISDFLFFGRELLRNVFFAGRTGI